MSRFAALKPVNDSDLELNIDQFSSRKRKLPSNSPSPSSFCIDHKENSIDEFLAKKRTNPLKFCPRRRPATQQAPAPDPAVTQPRRTITKEEDDAKLKKFLDARPQFRVERLPDAEESEDMKVLRAFRRQDFLAAQEAKKNGGFKEEPKPKKTRAKKAFWQKN